MRIQELGKNGSVTYVQTDGQTDVKSEIVIQIYALLYPRVQNMRVIPGTVRLPKYIFDNLSLNNFGVIDQKENSILEAKNQFNLPENDFLI